MRVVEDGIASGTFAPVAAVDLMTGVMDVAVTRIIGDPSVAKVTAAATATFLHDALSGPSASTVN